MSSLLANNIPKKKGQTSMIFNFVHVHDSGEVKFYFYEVPLAFHDELMQHFGIKSQTEIIISFHGFLDYDPKKHEPLLKHVFESYALNVKRVPRPEQGKDAVTYVLNEKDPLLEKLSLEDLCFVCGILSELNLKRYLLPLIEIAIRKHSVDFEKFKEMVKKTVPEPSLYAK